MITEEKVGGLTLLQDTEEFRLTRDALELSAFATLRSGDRVCDLGCGVGNLLIPLAARAEGLTLDGVELRARAAALCRENLDRNGLNGTIVTGDLNDCHEVLPALSYDLVAANPPYFSAASGLVSPNRAKATARTEGTYTLASACAAARRLCVSGGHFTLCLRPERLAELFAAMKETGFEPKRLQLVQTSAEKAPNLALVEGIKGAKPGLNVRPVKIER